MRFLGFRLLLLSMLALAGQPPAFGAGLEVLLGHVPSAQRLARAHDLGRKPASSRMRLAVSLKTKDLDGLKDLVRRLYDPADSHFHQFITPAQFTDSFAQSSDDVTQIVNYLKSKGLTILKVHANRMVIEVEGSTSTIENAFQIEMHEYLASDGRIVQAPTTEPILNGEIASKLNGIYGLNNFRNIRPHLRKSSKSTTPPDTSTSGLTPAQVKTAYSLNGLTQTGAGQSIALVELDAFTLSDVSAYAAAFSLATPPITVVPVAGGVSSPGVNADEVTLDIEMVMAIAPGVSNVFVYEAPPDLNNLISIYNRIAADNTAKIVSTSWGDAENDEDSNDFNYLGEQAAFLEMIGQGQTVLAAAGDNGAYDDVPTISTLQVGDPASQPYVTGVGGTTLELNSDNTYLFESSWNDTTESPAWGGGGGISRHFNIPTWQQGLATSSNLGSNTNRMVPDVSLNANPDTGYSIYYDGAWSVYGGTSCAAPLWAAYIALVNQQRIANGLLTIGFLNPSLYSVGTGIYYPNAFHDINDGSTNLYYPATTGYDLSTGWGSFNGAGLFSLLTTQTVSPGPSPSPSAFAPPSVPVGLTAQVYQ